MDWVHPHFYRALNNCTEIVMYKIQSQLRNDMLSALHLSTGGYLNLLYRVLVISDQAHKF